VTISKQGRPIRSLEEWRVLAGPKRPDQWQPGRSAMEAARSWLAVTSPALPVEIATALATNDAFGPVDEWAAEPEARLPFDTLRGETRNSDLLLRARDVNGPFIIAVESKADESFGETVDEALAAAQARRLTNSRSGGVKRVAQLLSTLFGSALEEERGLGALRYQLLTATAGALAAAQRQGGIRVVLLIQEFRTSRTVDQRLAANGADLDAFIARLTGGALHGLTSGKVHGPCAMNQAQSHWPPFFVAKVRHDLQALIA
jgi:hypothetical protein